MSTNILEVMQKMVILNALQGVLSILIMIIIGYFLTYKKLFDESTSKLFSKLVVNLSLPCLIISDLTSTFTKQMLSGTYKGIILAFVVILVTYFLGYLFSLLLKVSSKRRGIFCALFAFSNTVFIGLPVNLALFGNSSLPYVLLYYLGNTTLFWTLGLYVIKRSVNSKEDKVSLFQNIKKLCSPPLIAIFFALLFIVFEIKLPEFILSTCKYIGGLTTPLSLMFIGIVMFSVNFRDIHFDKETSVLIFGKLLLSPLLVYLILGFLSFPTLEKNVFIIQSSLPVMTQIAITAKRYDSDFEFATIMVTLTTILSMVLIPIIMYLISA
jgi:predicted permease